MYYETPSGRLIAYGRNRSRYRLLSRPTPFHAPRVQWDLRAQADRENKKHCAARMGKKPGTTNRSSANALPRLRSHEVTIESRRDRYAQCHRAMQVLTEKFKAAAPEAVVIVGNDQREFFDEGLTPSITVYRGAEIKNLQHLAKDNPPGINIAASPATRRLKARRYPGATPHSPTTFSIHSPTKTSTSRNPIPRRKPRLAAASPTPTASYTTRSSVTHRHPACPSS